MGVRGDDSGKPHLPATVQGGGLLRLDALKVLELRARELLGVHSVRDGLVVALQAENLSWVCLVAVVISHNLHAWTDSHH